MPEIMGINSKNEIGVLPIYQGPEEPITPQSFEQLVTKARRECTDRSPQGTSRYLDNICPKINQALRYKLQLDLINPGNPNSPKEVMEDAFTYANLTDLLVKEREEEAKTAETKLEDEIDNIRSSKPTTKISLPSGENLPEPDVKVTVAADIKPKAKKKVAKKT